MTVRPKQIWQAKPLPTHSKSTKPLIYLKSAASDLSTTRQHDDSFVEFDSRVNEEQHKVEEVEHLVESNVKVKNLYEKLAGDDIDKSWFNRVNFHNNFILNILLSSMPFLWSTIFRLSQNLGTTHMKATFRNDTSLHYGEKAEVLEIQRSLITFSNVSYTFPV